MIIQCFLYPFIPPLPFLFVLTPFISFFLILPLTFSWVSSVQFFPLYWVLFHFLPCCFLIYECLCVVFSKETVVFIFPGFRREFNKYLVYNPSAFVQILVDNIEQALIDRRHQTQEHRFLLPNWLHNVTRIILSFSFYISLLIATYSQYFWSFQWYLDLLVWLIKQVCYLILYHILRGGFWDV